jgi:4-amino-4-deoxy-L-arabinose transferase-like glycosyltransferase
MLRFSSSPKMLAVFLAFLGFYFIIGLFGYGNENDTYGMIHVGRQFLLDFKYHPSRPPGYLIPEISLGLTSLIGSYYLSNLMSAILGSITLYLFYQILKNIFDNTNALLITLVVGLNPYFIIASSSSTDYIYSLFFVFCGIALLDYRKYCFTGLLFSFAISSRLSSVMTITAIYIFFIFTYYIDKDKRKLLSRLVLSSIIALLCTIILYLPVFIASGYNFSFITYYMPDFSILEHLSRFIYKNIYLLGLLPFLLVFVTSLYFVFKKGAEIIKYPAVLFSIGIIVVQEILFYKIPLKISYLLPILFVIVPLWAFLINSKRALLVLLIFLTGLYNIVNIDILDRKYNEANTQCVAAERGIFIRPGILIDDLLLREKSQEIYFSMYSQSQPGFFKSPRRPGSGRFSDLGAGR